MSDNPNVFILSIDSLPYSAFEEASREIASLIDGVNFTEAIAPGSFTSSAMPALATGTHTDEIPAWGLPESGDPEPIAERLESNGYRGSLWTDNYLFGAEYNYDRGFSGGNLGRPSRKKQIANKIKESSLSPAFGLFETLYFNAVQPVMGLAGREGTFYRSADALNESALRWLNDGKATAEQPIFCWIHYMDTHHPYQPPREYVQRSDFNVRRSRSELGEFTRNAIKLNGEGLSEAELEDVKTAFDACADYLRDELRSFISELKQQAHYDPDSDILVVTADHGEVLDRETYQMLGHVPPAFWEDIVRVPLIVGRPDWTQSRFDSQVSLVDLTDLLTRGIHVSAQEDVSPEDFHRERAWAVSEWEELDDGSITTYRCVRTDSGTKCFGLKQGASDYVAVTQTDADGREVVQEKYDAADLDTSELSNAIRELIVDLENRGGTVEYQSGATNGMDVDEEHLRDLGYIQ